MDETETGTETTNDLRHARRERGINAVIDVALEIFMDGTEQPTASEIAQRAGVSTSSLFRYFASIDDLRTQAAARYVEEHRDLLEPRPADGADYEERLQLFVDLRIRVGNTLGPMNRRLHGRASNEPALIPIQSGFQAILAAQVETHFGPELAPLTPARRADLVAVVDSMTAIEPFRILDEVHGRTESQVRRSWLSALDAILR